MAATPPTKLKFSEYLEQKIQDRAGGEEQYKAIRKVWEEVKLRWTQAGYFSGGAPTKGQLMVMEEGLKEAVQKGIEGEIEGNRKHMFKKKGTKNREKAEAELRIGVWAIEETRRALPYKKPDMMGIVTSTAADSHTDISKGEEATQPSTRLYPALPTDPPPYSQGPTEGGKSRNPFRTGSPTPSPAVQAPVFAVKGGELTGTVSMGVDGGHLVCEEIQEGGTGSGGPTSLSDMVGGSRAKHSSTPLQFPFNPNPDHYLRCGSVSPGSSGPSSHSHENHPSGNDEGGTRHTPRDMEFSCLQRQVNDSLTQARSYLERSEREGGVRSI